MRCNVGDRGSSVVEFVLMSTLLMLLLFAMMQVGLFMYARTITQAAAADGARYAAAAGMPPSAGGRRADESLRSGLHGAGSAIVCTGASEVDAPSGLEVTTVRCTGRLHSLFAPLGAWLSIDVSASALREHLP